MDENILPPPSSYIIMVKLSFTKNVVFLHTCACTMPHIFFHDGKLYFRLKQLTAISIWAQLCCDCQGEESPPKVIFLRRLSSTEGHLPPKFVFHWRLSSTKGPLLSKVFFHRRVSSTEGIVLHRRSPSTKDRLPPNITPWLILYLWEQSSYQISASYLA